MKLLIENFKKFLNERSTDEYYRRYTDFYGNLFDSGEWARYYHVFEYTPTKRPQNPCPNEPNTPLTPFSMKKTYSKSTVPPNNPEEAGWWFYIVPKETPIENIYNKYKKETEDNGELITDIAMFASAHIKFKILIAHPSVRGTGCGAGGDMGHRGVMRLFSGENGYFYDKPNLNNIISNIKEGDLFAHEFVHWINSFRSGYKEIRAKGGIQNRYVGTKEYTASTEELQARMIEFSKSFIDYFLKRAPTDYNPEESPEYTRAHLAVIKAIQDGDIKKLINITLSFGDFTDQLAWDWDHRGWPGVKDNPKAAKRLLGRLYQVFEYFVNNKDKFPATKGE